MREVIDRPVFVIGTGRSGTTLFFRLLGVHPDLAWFSNYADRFHHVPAIALLSRLRDGRLGDRLIRSGSRYVPAPRETYSILDDVTDGLFTAPRRLRDADVSERIRDRYRRRVAQTLFFQGKTRFAQKHTGFARTRFLLAVFPDARFIHVYRDGRASALSLAKVDWWRGMESWRWGPMKPEYAAEYERSGRSRLLLAAISWKTLLDDIEEETRGLPPDRFLSIRYDALVADPQATLERALAFAELDASDAFRRRLASLDVQEGMDTKWQRDLSPADRATIEACLAGHLQHWGFAQ